MTLEDDMELFNARGANAVRASRGLRGGPLNHNPTPFAFVPDPYDFWENELYSLIADTKSIVFQHRPTGDYLIRGEGVRLRLPGIWWVGLASEEIVQRIITGIRVSLDHQKRLGY